MLFVRKDIPAQVISLLFRDSVAAVCNATATLGCIAAVVTAALLIRCCWTSSMEQSANPAAKVRYYTRTISTSTQNASIWSLTAAAPSDSVFRALCINWLTYLLIYSTNISMHALRLISQTGKTA